MDCEIDLIIGQFYRVPESLLVKFFDVCNDGVNEYLVVKC